MVINHLVTRMILQVGISTRMIWIYLPHPGCQVGLDTSGVETPGGDWNPSWGVVADLRYERWKLIIIMMTMMIDGGGRSLFKSPFHLSRLLNCVIFLSFALQFEYSFGRCFQQFLSNRVTGSWDNKYIRNKFLQRWDDEQMNNNDLFFFQRA